MKETIKIRGTTIEVEFDYTEPEPTLGYKGGYGLISVNGLYIDEFTEGFLDEVHLELENLKKGVER